MHLKIILEYINIINKLHTGLGIVGASEDSGGPRLVGGRLVALGQDLAALAAPPTFELLERAMEKR